MATILSEDFQKELIDVIREEVKEAVKAVERQAVKPLYVRRVDVPKLFVDERVTLGTVSEWEKLGLQRCEPKSGGGVFFEIEEVKRFMKQYGC